MDEIATTGTVNVAAEELRQFIERIERLEEEKQSIADDIKDVFGEAKSRGYDTKAMKTIVRLRKKTRTNAWKRNLFFKHICRHSEWNKRRAPSVLFLKHADPQVAL